MTQNRIYINTMIRYALIHILESRGGSLSLTNKSEVLLEVVATLLLLIRLLKQTASTITTNTTTTPATTYTTNYTTSITTETTAATSNTTTHTASAETFLLAFSLTPLSRISFSLLTDVSEDFQEHDAWPTREGIPWSPKNTQTRIMFIIRLSMFIYVSREVIYWLLESWKDDRMEQYRKEESSAVLDL